MATIFFYIILILFLRFLFNIISPKKKRKKTYKSKSSIKGSLSRQNPRINKSKFENYKFELDKEKEWSVELLRKLEWKRLEMLSQKFFTSIGFRSHLTSVGADGGVDVVLYNKDNNHPVGITQCKAWGRPVGVKSIREFFGVMAADQVDEGIFITTGTFTKDARKFAVGKRLELVDGEKLIKYIRKLPANEQKALQKDIFSGDYWTPTCPSCNVKMVERTAKKGCNVGNTFYGCPNYPRCRSIMQIR